MTRRVVSLAYAREASRRLLVRLGWYGAQALIVGAGLWIAAGGL